jgi:hypothetical protein
LTSAVQDMVNPKWATVLLTALLLSGFFAVLQVTGVQTKSAVDDWSMFRHDPEHTGYTNSTGPTTTPVVL